jgi:uncharacterized membrane protein YkvA (DUF1232 family)
MVDHWKQKAKNLKKELYALYLAYKDPRLPWHVRVIAIIVVGYAFSPIDLIPDPIPVLGYLDDLILIPLGIALLIKLVPPDILNECREKAQNKLMQSKPKNWFAAGIIILIWIILFALIGYYCLKLFKRF